MANATPEPAIRDDVVVGTNGTAGAAAAVDPGRMFLPSPRPGRRTKGVAGPAYDRAGELPAAFDTRYPPDPRHCLAFRAARPDPQNRGIGSALLNRHHARLDRAGLPAHQEANDHHNRDLHLRHGHSSRPVNQMPGGSSLWSKRRLPMA
ncbi:hypothetical protein ACFFRK_24425 [Amorphoplanes digitatis]|uniref:hypothetical protein n=1 Tax=Actinoplanes digitatis TaxID=1868 RepID=UPI0019413107|nr:hypothetical protein [Actinoplanes digitatis]